MPYDISSILLKSAGAVCFLGVFGHHKMGTDLVAPQTRATDALKAAYISWNQGNFLYALLGLNDIRLALQGGLLTQLDQATVVLQLAFHTFTLLKFRPLPYPEPKVLSAVLIGLVGAASAALKLQR